MTRKLIDLYFIVTTRKLLFAGFNLFIPVFIYKQLEANQYESPLLIVIGLFLFSTIVNTIFLPFSLLIIKNYGTKFSIFVSQCLLLSLLFLTQANSINDLVIAFSLLGISNALYWMAYHLTFLEANANKNLGMGVGLVNSLEMVAVILVPLIFGASLSYSSGLFFLVVVILILIPFLAFAKLNIKKSDISITKLRILPKQNMRDFLAFSGVGAEEIIYSVAWPLILFSILSGYLEIGIFTSVVALFTAVISIYAGKLSDGKNPKRTLVSSSILVAITFVMRILTVLPLGIFIVDTLYRVVSRFYFIPLNTIAYKNAIQDDPVNYLLQREIGYKVGNILGLIFFLVIIYLELPLAAILIVAAVVSPLAILIKEKKTNYYN